MVMRNYRESNMSQTITKLDCVNNFMKISTVLMVLDVNSYNIVLNYLLFTLEFKVVKKRYSTIQNRVLLT